MAEPENSDINALEELDPAVRELLPRYLERRRADAARLAELLERPDWEELRIIGHNMRGSGSAYGQPALSRIGAGIEEAATARDEEVLQGLVHDLVKHLASR